MKYTAEGLRDTLLSMIEEMGNHPERYAKNPGKDFTRRRSLTLPALMKLIVHFLSCSTVSPMLWMRQRDFGVIGCWPWTALP